MPLLSPLPSPPPNASPGVTPSHSPVTMKVSHLLTSPGSSTALLSLPWILVSPPQSCAQNLHLALWKRVREGHTLAVQVTLSVVAALTLRSSYKVSAHMHTLTVCVCSSHWKFRAWFTVHKWCMWCATSSEQLLTRVPSVSHIPSLALTVSNQKLLQSKTERPEMELTASRAHKNGRLE